MKIKVGAINLIWWHYGVINKSVDQSTFRSSLLFEDVGNFEQHLKSRSEDIREVISRLVSHSPKAAPEVSEIQNQLARKLAEEKATITDLEKALSEKQQLEERLEAASLRYMVAEKKLDRARSATVAKLEKQHIFGAQRPGGDSASGNREEQSPVNGVTPSAEGSADVEEAHNKLAAISEKQKEQLRKLETENSNLLGQITDLKIKVKYRRTVPIRTCLICYSTRNPPTMIMRIRIYSSN